MVQLSHPYMTSGKTRALTRQTSVFQVMFLLFNMFSRLVMDFLCSSAGKESAWSAGDLGLIPGLRKSHGGGHVSPFCILAWRIPREQRSLAGCRPWDGKESDLTQRRSAAQHTACLYSGSCLNNNLVKLFISHIYGSLVWHVWWLSDPSKLCCSFFLFSLIGA